MSTHFGPRFHALTKAPEIPPLGPQGPSKVRELGSQSDPGTGGLDTDANWLIVQGTVTHANGERFEFTDPCLLTSEADEWQRGRVSYPRR